MSVMGSCREPRNRRSLGSWSLLLLLGIAGLSGCENTESLDMPVESMVTNDPQRKTDLRQGLDLLNRMDEFDSAQALPKVRYHLQQWLRQQPPHPHWISDPLARRLPQRFQSLVTAERLSGRELEAYDVQVLQEAIWLRDVANSVVQQPQLPPDLRQLIDSTLPVVEPDRQSDLIHALRLFDWTVRNLQLEQIQQDGRQRFGSDLILQCWESLLMGRGTLEEKSRVFMLLARQLGITVVMLGMDTADATEPSRPWLPAVLLGDQLYLLDMQLGLAICGPDGKSVATLEQVLEQPELLQRMAESEQQPYRVPPAELRKLVAMVDATPGALSQRMKILEAALLGDQKMLLTVTPSPLAAALRRCAGISRVEIWTLPYEAFVQRSDLASSSPRVAGLAQEHGLFDRRTPLGQARLLHFRGQFDWREGRPGARALYLECRTPEAQIEQIRNTLRTRSADRSERLTAQQQAQQQQRAGAVEQLMVRTKQNASYWLGLIAFDVGDYQVASDYFEKRLLASDPDSIWASGARYNLGRCQEAIGWRDGSVALLQRAVQSYQVVEDSPLTAGCRVRARRLARSLEPERESTP